MSNGTALLQCTHTLRVKYYITFIWMFILCRLIIYTGSVYLGYPKFMTQSYGNVLRKLVMLLQQWQKWVDFLRLYTMVYGMYNKSQLLTCELGNFSFLLSFVACRILDTNWRWTMKKSSPLYFTISFDLDDFARKWNLCHPTIYSVLLYQYMVSCICNVLMETFSLIPIVHSWE